MVFILDKLVFIFMTNLSNTDFLTTSLSSTLLSIVKSAGTVFSLVTSILSISAFNSIKEGRQKGPTYQFFSSNFYKCSSQAPIFFDF